MTVMMWYAQDGVNQQESEPMWQSIEGDLASDWKRLHIMVFANEHIFESVAQKDMFPHFHALSCM